MTKLQAIRKFVSFVCDDKVIIIRERFEGTNFGMSISDKNPRLKIPSDLSLPSDEADKIFRKNFVERYSSAQGFANITLTLLHECGHWMTRSIADPVEYDKMVARAWSMYSYLNIPWERIATEWAICWLCSPANRKVAKAFEKEYFGHA